MMAGVTTRLKVLAKLDIAERRKPQDGRISLNAAAAGRMLDIRVATLPTVEGESVVMRLLDKSKRPPTLEELGLSDEMRRTLEEVVARPTGALLVTGPTGSGKSTTLYAILARLGTERQNMVNISTIEDPVEHPLPRVSQVSVNPSAGIDFASGLRSLLRQDPDIIMVGEIRDRDTADIAIRAALVGRLLLSSLHTNDATTTIPRLIDMGIEPFLLATTLAMVVAQRLVRLICVGCRESIDVGPEVVEMLSTRADSATALGALRAQGMLGPSSEDFRGVRLFRGKGCRQCGGSGYRGRVGLFEILQVDDEIRRMILDRRDAASIRSIAIQRGMKTMFQDGLAKILLGQTTVEELVRVTICRSPKRPPAGRPSHPIETQPGMPRPRVDRNRFLRP